MSDINSISANVISSADAFGQKPAGQQQAGRGPSATPPQDVFVQGQWWANRAGSKEDNLGDGEQGSGGNRRQVEASRAYSSQQNALSGEGGAAEAEGGQARGDRVGDKNDGTASAGASTSAEDGRGKTPAESKANDATLSDEELQELQVLKKVDTKVRAHELAHLSVAGSYARGGVSFQYKRGPDGRNYAVGGEVPIDVSKESTPEATINKMQVVRAAALAPADPSPQDRKVAVAATAAMNEAQQQLRLEELAQSDTRAGNAEAVNATDTAGKAGQLGSPAGAEERSRNGLIGRYLGASPPAESNGFAVVV